MQEKLAKLKQLLTEIEDLNAVGELLGWDQSTYMPPGGTAGRARQQAVLARLAQEKQIDPAIGQLLQDLHPYEQDLPYDSDDASLIRVARRQYERLAKLPPDLVAEFTSHTAQLYQTWTEARPANDFGAVQPGLEKTLELSHQMASYYPGSQHIADPLIDFADHGMTVSTIRPLFAQLRDQLVPMVEAIAAQPEPDQAFLSGHFPKQAQWDFGVAVITRFGYDFQRGRQDLTHHPFMTKFSLGDVRILTNVKEHDLLDALFSSAHEAGHAMYEQGIRWDYEATPLAHGASSGMHESQSRLWENMVARSRPFWTFYYPRLQQAFPGQLDSTPLDAFYRAINRVRTDLIRIAADEVTYNLHVIIRFELELELLEGTLAIKDLPEAWHDRYQSYLGVRAPDDRDGVLQDVHWYAGRIGGVFQGYTLGNIISGIVLEQALAAHPEIYQQMAEGSFETLHGWLREQIYQHGSKYTAAELVQRLTGSPLSIDPYMRYLRTKYGQLYDL